jgi:hypothetical protein
MVSSFIAAAPSAKERFSLIRVKADGFLEFATWLLFAVLQRKTANILAVISLFRFSESEEFRGRGLVAGCYFCCKNSERGGARGGRMDPGSGPQGAVPG